MNKIFLKFTLAVATILLTLSANASEHEMLIDSGENAFDGMNGADNTSREKIVVISDLHLGNDLSYTECVKHLSRLEQFLNEIRSSKTVKELVIAGDLFDQWYVPSRIDTYRGKSQKEFVERIVSTNQIIFNVLNGIIKDGKVKLTYVPGNHDLIIDAKNVNDALPGVNQARDDNKLGLGTYHPDRYPQIAIEHGHRYDFFCSPDPDANRSEAPGSILPQGYFFTRIFANTLTDPVTKDNSNKVPVVRLNSKTPEQFNKYEFYSICKTVLENSFYVKDNFDELIFNTNIDHFTKKYSINDFLPHNNADGTISMNLYDNSFTQEAWEKRLVNNNVPFVISLEESMHAGQNTKFIDKQADVQYFQNPKSKVRVVVFGHTHAPLINSYTNPKGEACVYANSGTWIDSPANPANPANPVIDQETHAMNFVVIMPRKVDKKNLNVGLYKYTYGKHVYVEDQTIRL